MSGTRKRDRLRAKLRSRRHEAPTISEPRPDDWADGLADTGVENLHRITPLLYRSAQPGRADIAALRALDIRTVVSLRSFNDDAKVFAGVGDIALMRIAINTWDIDDAKVLRALQTIRAAQSRGPVLIHCLHGADRTGVVSAVYRIAMQGGDKETARAEMLRGGFGYHTLWRNIPRYLDRLDPDAMRRALETAA